MAKKDMSDYKKKYDAYRHHAWAGSVLLAVLVALRGFLELSDVKIDDNIIIVIGLGLVIYVLIAVFFTYKYRSGLLTDSKNIVEVQVKSSELEKERLKIEKKKAKTEAKKAKKQIKNEL